jgi:TnpA family transposase
VLPHQCQVSYLEAIVYQRLRELKLEPPSRHRLNRLIHSAVCTFETTVFSTLLQQLSARTRAQLDDLLKTATALEEDESTYFKQSVFSFLKTDPSSASLKSIFKEIEKLQYLRQLELPSTLFTNFAPKRLDQYRRRASTQAPRELRRHPPAIRYTLLAAFCWQRQQEIVDSLVELLVQIVHRIHLSAERRIDKELIDDFKRVDGKPNLLFRIAEAALEYPEQLVKDVVYPVVSRKTLQNLVQEFKLQGPTYRERVYTVMRSSYLHHYRQMVPHLLDMLEFRSNNERHRPVVNALELLKKYKDSRERHYSAEETLFVEGVLSQEQQDLIVEADKEGNPRINRVNYEICVLQALRAKLRCREIWVAGAKRYGNPEADLPQDFEARREIYYRDLQQPLDATAFISQLQQEMAEALSLLDKALPSNPTVRISKKGHITVSPLKAQSEPLNLLRLKTEVGERWSMTSLLDMLKETDLRVHFTEQFKTDATREYLEPETLQRRLLLCLYGLGTNTGLKRVCAGSQGETYAQLLRIKKHYIHREHLRNAITQVVNDLLRIRHPQVWGEATTACASDSKKFGCWDQNLMTEWHIRYGGRGVMIYWHVEKKSACIYSQLKTCSSSEVAAMLEGLLRHYSDLKVDKNYVDTHGQSEVAFAFCRLLGFQLMPRIKRICDQKLYLSQSGQKTDFSNLQPILARAIDWEVIRQQYDQLVKYATALRLGTAETDSVLRRFSRSVPQHPTYRALVELGRAVKTIFLCQYLLSESVRQEIQEGLNVVESWNRANDFILYGRSGEIASNRRDDQEIAALSLHLLQICLVYVNTLMIQQVLTDKFWLEQMQAEDLRALTPLIWAHVNPYGIFRLDLNERLQLDTA